MWFEGRWDGGNKVGLEGEEQGIGRVVTGREKVADDQINVVL